MDKDGDIQKMTINLKGTIEGSAKVQAGTPRTRWLTSWAPSRPTKGPAPSRRPASRESVQLELYTTAENRHLIESYMGNLASGNDAGAVCRPAGDLPRVLPSRRRLNSMVSTETNAG